MNLSLKIYLPGSGTGTLFSTSFVSTIGSFTTYSVYIGLLISYFLIMGVWTILCFITGWETIFFVIMGYWINCLLTSGYSITSFVCYMVGFPYNTS